MAIEYPAIVGNGETVALINKDLTISWFCAPRIDDFPFFASLLDPVRGGSLRFLTDFSPSSFRQRYLEKTNILETTAEEKGIELKVTDFMPWGQRCLVRKVCFTNKSSSSFCPSLDIELKSVQSEHLPTKITDLTPFMKAISGKNGTICIGIDQERINFEPCLNQKISLPLLAPLEKLEFSFVIGYGKDLSEAVSSWKEGLKASLLTCENFWQSWLKKEINSFELSDQKLKERYERSLLVLKLLNYEPTGAIVAAATASIPATPYGWENWDYRYVWLRDGYYVSLAYDQAGFFEEARRFYNFICFLQEEDGSWPQPLYTVDGDHPHEKIITDLRGPLGEEPIRFGNQAAIQLQLDNVGNVVHGIWHHYYLSGDFAFLARLWPNVKLAAFWVENNWHRYEQGIWEIRERMDHWVHGKAMCAVALFAAANIAHTLGFRKLGRRFAQKAEKIRRQVLTRGYSPVRRAFLRHYGKDAVLDASVLVLPLYNLISPADPRILSTVEQIEKPLAAGGLNLGGGICRYEGATSAFYLTTLWLARYYLRIGNIGRTEELLNLCLDSATELGLMAEHFNPLNGEQYGNFPQAFHHSELILTILDLERAKRKIKRRVELDIAPAF